jgi:hypothetical protein
VDYFDGRINHGSFFSYQIFSCFCVANKKRNFGISLCEPKPVNRLSEGIQKLFVIRKRNKEQTLVVEKTFIVVDCCTSLKNRDRPP